MQCQQVRTGLKCVCVGRFGINTEGLRFIGSVPDCDIFEAFFCSHAYLKEVVIREVIQV